jgi:hypothetical protein
MFLQSLTVNPTIYKGTGGKHEMISIEVVKDVAKQRDIVTASTKAVF